jgi:hypothetical protein
MDLGTVVAAVLRPGVPAGGRDERIAFSLRLLAPLLDGRLRLGEAGADLAREIHEADPASRATLILPAGPGPARIEFGGRPFTIPAALRDALAAVLSNAAGAASAAAPRAPAAPVPAAAEPRLPTQSLVAAATAAVAGAGAAAAEVLVATGATRAAGPARGREPSSAMPFDTPLFDPRDPSATAQRVAARVAGSGLFLESHLAQWARGERDAQSVHAEARQLARAAASEGPAAELRAVRQLDTLQRQCLALAGPAWEGQPMRLELGRDLQVTPDGEAHGDGAADRVYVARLRLELPGLGTLDVRLRLAGATVAATVACGADAGTCQRVAGALPELGAALTARGLTPAALRAAPVAAAEPEA